MVEDNDQDAVAGEEAGEGLADSPAEVVPDAPSEKDPDAGPTATPEEVEQDSERDQAEG